MPKLQRDAKVLWAVDISATDIALQAKMAVLLKLWSSVTDQTVEPVYLLGPHQLRMPPEHFRRHAAEIRASARAKMVSLLGRVSELPRVGEPKLMTSDTASLREMARELLSYARATEAGLIAITSRSRRGVGRLLWGSFAESLVAQSTVPLLIVTPKTRPITKIRQILFPTDLNPRSRKPFLHVINMAKQNKAQLILFHESEFLVEHGEAAFGPPESYNEALKADLNKKRIVLSQLAWEARSAGVKTKLVLLDGGEGPARDIARFAAKMPSGIIAMISHKEGMRIAFPGSVTRNVVRHADLPVWVIHSK